jgi:flavin reductase (DIM6/NTAB) family NADH-FMN oxidoreductase RutF
LIYKEVSMTPDMSANDVRTEALNFLTNGVYILTAATPDTVHAATVTWASQVSFQPALVLVALRRNSHLAQAVRKAHRFALNIVAEDQQDIMARFFSHYTGPSEGTPGPEWPFRMTLGKCPLLIDSIAWLECKLVAEPPSPGDHALMLGEVTGAGVRRQGRPMVLRDTPWSYGGIKEEM